MSLRHRLAFMMVLALPLGLMICALLSYFYSVKLVQKELGGAVETGETTVREVLDGIDRSADPSAAMRKLVSSFDRDRDINVRFIGPGGATVAASLPATVETPPPKWLVDALWQQPRTAFVGLPGALKAYGGILIEAAPENEISEVWEEMTLQLLMFVGVFSIFLWISLFTIDRALRPLEKLAAALVEVGKGNFAAQVPESGPSEMAIIYREFNSMALELKASEERNRSLGEHLHTVQEEERADLARDLHDEIGPFLFAVDVDAQTIKQYIARGATQDAVERARAIRQSVAHMQGHVRGILNVLRPAALIDLGLSEAIEQLVTFWRGRRPGVEVTTRIARASIGPEVDEAAYRIVQEALSNALRHGKPKRIDVTMAVDEVARTVTLSVVDDGGGMGGAPVSGNGFGIAWMGERAAAIGGTLAVNKNPVAPGVAIVATLPLGPAQARAEAASAA